MRTYLSTWWTLSLLVASTYQAGIPKRSAQCDCFKTESGAIYQNEVLVDFRYGRPQNFESFFRRLDAPNYAAGSTVNHMSNSQVAFARDHLALLAKRKDGQQYSGSLESRDTVHYGSFRARYAIKASGTGGQGAVSGFFTFKAGGDNELDIEILTSEPKTRAHYSTHVEGGEGGGNPTFVKDFPFGWDQMLTHRFDWEPDVVRFWVEDRWMGDLRKGVPQSPSTLCLNMWSSGEQTWGGSMAEGGEARMEIRWVQGFYNTTQDRQGCEKMCYVG